MRKLTKIKIWAVIIIAAIIVSAVTLRISLHVIPDNYKPYILPKAQMDSAAADFRSFVLELFGSAGRVGSVAPQMAEITTPTIDKLTVSFTAEQVNRWIAAMDVKIVREMAKAGFVGPSVVVNDGSISFYVRYKPKQTVISLKLSPSFDDDGRMRLKIISVKLGAVKIPKSWLDEHIRRLTGRMRNRLEAIQSSGRDKLGPLPLDDASVTLKQLLDAAKGKPVELNFPKRYGLASISDIKLTEGNITLTVKSKLTDKQLASAR